MSRVVTRSPLREHIATLPRYIAGSHHLVAPQSSSLAGSSGSRLRAILSANENPYGAGQSAREAIQHFLAKQIIHRYPEIEQEEFLLEALIKTCASGGETKEKTRQKKRTPAYNQLLLANGSDELISLLVQATITSGDNALVCSNSFPVYTLALRAAEAEVREVERLKPLYALDVEGVGRMCDQKTKLFFVANPDNPTGRCENTNTIKQLLNVLPPWVLLVLDSAYAEYVTENDYDSGMKFVLDNAQGGGRVVMLRTFSKIHGLAALRLGWALADPKIISALRALRMPFSVNALALAAGLGAIGDREHVEFSREQNAKQRARFTRFAQENSLRPLESQANFVMLDCQSEQRANILAQQWRAAGFLTRSCAHNAIPSALRVTIGREDEMSALMQVPLDLPKASSS